MIDIKELRAEHDRLKATADKLSTESRQRTLTPEQRQQVFNTLTQALGAYRSLLADLNEPGRVTIRRYE